MERTYRITRRSQSRKKPSIMKDLIDKIAPHELIGLGEATHGNYKNSWERMKIIKRLIQYHGIREVFLEDDVFQMVKISADKGQNLGKLMNVLQYPFDNIVMRNLYKWIFKFNEQNPKDKVAIYGADIQLYQLEDISDNSKLGELYRKWANYSMKQNNTETYAPRDKAMAKMIEAQHKPGVKAVLIFHNDHLDKSEVSGAMGFHINKIYKTKYIVVANTFTRGVYHGLFMPDQKERASGLRTEFQDIPIKISDPNFKHEIQLFDPNKQNYIYEGQGQVDKRDPDRYFEKKSSSGFDLILLINNETPLKPFVTNKIFS